MSNKYVFDFDHNSGFIPYYRRPLLDNAVNLMMTQQLIGHESVVFSYGHSLSRSVGRLRD